MELESLIEILSFGVRIWTNGRGYGQMGAYSHDLRFRTCNCHLGSEAWCSGNSVPTLQKGIPPWVPLKGREPKTYKQLQKEAIESKKRDMAVMEANDGVWPGVRTPSHALFLWASGFKLTTILESDHMPNKFIPKRLRQELTKVIPGLRPWEVISIEQAMDQISYNGKWYREPLGVSKSVENLHM